MLKNNQSSTSSVKSQPQSYVCLLRTMTRKSIIGFGTDKYKNLSVQQCIDAGYSYDLIRMYFGLSKISFTKDILDELGIAGEFILNKPGKNNDLVKPFNKISFENMTEKERMGACMRNKTARKRNAERRVGANDRLSRSFALQNKNLNR